VSILGLVTEDRHELALLEGRVDTVIPAFLSFSRASTDGSKSMSKSADETGSAIRISVTISLAETKTMLAEAFHIQRLEFFSRSRGFRGLSFNH
jgi:hypothetical protein